ncbi:DinB family protein [Pengzhenrongella sicca]|uniref:DinB family protein n=1 Tax=Pengzhenrongella sicca TaxID=2819238 RepID=A0A8A4ZIJ3_9MICO|nr:DinB family protein [Pengzhenrongella sicca]QTE29428.1 DinB family protein [Pengzhenrongella sicca]
MTNEHLEPADQPVRTAGTLPARPAAEPTSAAETRTAPPIEPDTKDWTWVITRPCPECGFAAAETPPDAIGATARALAARWQVALDRPNVAVRPDPGTWSVLEYGAHVRDVNRIFAERLRAILELDYPMFANWDQDAAAVEQHYELQDPQTVAGELVRAAAVLADRFDAVEPDQLDRPGRRSNGSDFTVITLGRYYLHDVVHHLHDVAAA